MKREHIVIINQFFTYDKNIVVRAYVNKFHYFDEYGRRRSADGPTSWYVRSGDEVVFRGWANPKRTEEAGTVFLDFSDAAYSSERFLDPSVYQPDEAAA